MSGIQMLPQFDFVVEAAFHYYLYIWVADFALASNMVLQLLNCHL